MRAIFLDLDGTLIDPKEGITSSIQHALKEMGVAEIPSADELTWCIGPPLAESFQTLLGPGADVAQALDEYRAHYTDEAMYLAEPYDGIDVMFEEFHITEIPLFIATSKPHIYATTLVEHFGIAPHIERLFGSELSGERADKTALLQFALDETGIDPANAVMLGDRRHDMFGARNNDIPSIGALWGYGDPDELHMAEADRLAGVPDEVPEIAFELLGLSD